MKTFRLFSMAALALMMAACSNNDDNEILQNTQQPGTMHFTATIAAPSGDATTRTVYTEDGTTIKVKWEVGDKIALVHNGVVDEAEVKTVDDVTGKATIEADITGSPSDNDDVYLAYPADAVYSATPYQTFHFTPNPTTFNKVKNDQDGTLAYIQNNLDLRTGDGKLAVSGDKVTLKESVSIPSIICIWKLTLQDESSNPLSATQLTFKNETYTQAKATSAAKSEYYLCVVPGYIPAPAGTYSFEATVGSDTYTFSKTDLNLTAGKYYKSTVTMAKVAPAATSLSELKTAINGGTDCSSYIGWEVNSAGAIAESGVSGTKIGYVAYVSTSDVDADVSGSRILVIASADAAATTLTWGSSGTARGVEAVEDANNLKGYSNTNTLQGYGSEAHPAAYAAWNYSATIPSGGATPAHWFMPTKKQRENMRDAKGGAYSAMATAYGISGQYWTSNEYFNGEDYSECKNYAWRFAPNSTFMSIRKSFDINVRSIFAY